jgi:predicted nucleotidyltransferase
MLSKVFLYREKKYEPCIVGGVVVEPLGEFVAQVRTAMTPYITCVVLFGSRATGKARHDSDYDVALFVVDSAPMWPLRKLASSIAYRFILRGVEIRPVVLAEKHWDADSQFARHIREFGKRVL